MYDNPSSSFINRYEKGEMGGCEKASKMATRATRFDYPLFFTEVIGHCLLHKARKTSRYLNFRLLITIIQFNNWVRKESARRKSERKEIAKLVKHDIAEVKARKLDLA
jgi:hypothetical protein